MREVHLDDVLRTLFPDGSEWAQRCVQSLRAEQHQIDPVVAASVGISTSVATHGDETQTLFVLTASALGLGQDTGEGLGLWVDLRRITNLDALIDDSTSDQSVEVFLDNVFVPDDGDGRTFAEMSDAEKHAISHRGRAFQNLRDTVENTRGEFVLIC